MAPVALVQSEALVCSQARLCLNPIGHILIRNGVMGGVCGITVGGVQLLLENQHLAVEETREPLLHGVLSTGE